MGCHESQCWTLSTKTTGASYGVLWHISILLHTRSLEYQNELGITGLTFSVQINYFGHLSVTTACLSTCLVETKKKRTNTMTDTRSNLLQFTKEDVNHYAPIISLNGLMKGKRPNNTAVEHCFSAAPMTFKNYAKQHTAVPFVIHANFPLPQFVKVLAYFLLLHVAQLISMILHCGRNEITLNIYWDLSRTKLPNCLGPWK